MEQQVVVCDRVLVSVKRKEKRGDESFYKKGITKKLYILHDSIYPEQNVALQIFAQILRFLPPHFVFLLNPLVITWLLLL